jgi:hypothetical protein
MTLPIAAWNFYEALYRLMHAQRLFLTPKPQNRP